VVTDDGRTSHKTAARKRPRVIEPPSDGFWMQTPRGVVAHVTGDRNMSDESAKALSELIEAAYDHMSDRFPEPATDG
jgi:hypothetical protein